MGAKIGVGDPFVRFYKSYQYFTKRMKFHKSSWYHTLLLFDFNVLGLLSLSVLLKVDCKILVSFGLFRNFELGNGES